MITASAVKSLAVKFQTTELNVRREYLQHLFLAGFYRQAQSDQVYFQGGTALRILYGSPRFSEDLDFSSSLTDISALEDAVLGAMGEITQENVGVDVVESTTTSGGYLAILSFQVELSPMTVQLEISLRESEKRGEAETIVSDFMPAYTVVALARDLLIDEKMQALLFRQKARDFYDLYFMLRANLQPAPKKEALAQALVIVGKTKIDFDRELKEFLPRSHWGMIRAFPGVLEREIHRYL